MDKFEHHNKTDQGHMKIMTIPSANAREFGRILKMLNSAQANSPIVIRNSTIRQPIISDNFIVEIDLKNLIGDGINMTPLLLEGEIKEVLDLLSSGETMVTFDPDEGVYLFQNGYRSETLLAAEDNGQGIAEPLVFSAKDYLGAEVVIEDIADINKFLLKSSCCGLLIYGNQLEQVMSFNKSAPYTFKKAAAGNLKYEKAEMCLLSFNFLRFSDNDSKIKLAANDEKGFWLITEVEMTAKSTIKTYELLAEHNA